MNQDQYKKADEKRKLNYDNLKVVLKAEVEVKDFTSEGPEGSF